MTRANLHLMPVASKVEVGEVESLAKGGQVLACDFSVNGAEKFTAEPWGYRRDSLVNIDHHAPTTEMARIRSSTNLALLWVKANGRAAAQDCVVINHTDCDSVLSSAIVLGDLEPLERYGAAAVAADHTGVPNRIVDLLQALDARRCYDLSLRNLRLLENGAPLEPAAQKALDERLRQRATAAELVREGRFTMKGSLAFAVLDEVVDGEFFPALLPNAVVILACSPRLEGPEKWNAKLRLGRAAPAGFSLHDPQLKELDKDYGGRWNAGSNRRGGGTSLPYEIYAE